MDNLTRYITTNLPMLFVIFGVIFLLILIIAVSTKKKETNYRNGSNYRNASNYNRNIDLISFDNQVLTEATALTIVSKSNYSKRPLMNRSEYTLFRKLEDLLEKQHKGQRFRLFSQVAMGEFMKSESDEAFRLINGKRVDFVIVDSSGEAVIVIEYQGAGHYQDNAVERDAIKREACRKANIEFLEFKKNYDNLEFERVSRILNASSSQNRQATNIVDNLEKITPV